WQFAEAFRAEGAVRVRVFDDDRFHLRRVKRGRDDVIRQAVVDDAPALPDQFLAEAVTDGLKRAAFDLPGGQDRVNRAADVLRGGDLLDGDFKSVYVNFDFGDLGAPRISRVS